MYKEGGREVSNKSKSEVTEIFRVYIEEIILNRAEGQTYTPVIREKYFLSRASAEIFKEGFDMFSKLSKAKWKVEIHEIPVCK